MTEGAPTVFRSTFARVSAWVWIVFVALNLIDIAVRGRDLSALAAVAVLAFGTGVAYVLGLRPRIVAEEAGLRLHNPLRDLRVPWTSVHAIEAREAIVIRYDDSGGTERTARSWVFQTSPRARVESRSPRDRTVPKSIAEQVKGRTPAGYAAERLNEFAVAARRPARPPAVLDGAGLDDVGPDDVGPDDARSGGALTWSRPAVAALILPALLLAVIIATALLR